MPDLEIALASDDPQDLQAPFTTHIQLAETNGFRAKILAAGSVPFERSLLLDTDTYVTASLDDVFRLLDRFDIAAAHAPGRTNFQLDDIPPSFPEFNTGVVALRASAAVSALIDMWLHKYDALRRSNDQPAFRWATFHARDVRIATLPPEFNQLFMMGGFQCQKVRVLHGWTDGHNYEQIAAAMNDPVMDSDYAAVFIGMRLFNSRGRLIADWGPHRKFKAIRSALLHHL